MPPLAAITFTVTVQELLAGIEPVIKVTFERFVRAANSVLLQVVRATPTTTKPLGSVSIRGAVRMASVASGLLKVIVSVDVPPALIVAGLNALPSVGWLLAGELTVNVAIAGAVLLPLPVCKTPAASELI